MSAASGSSGSAFMDNLRQLFAECDLDGSGSLVKSEFKELCSKIGLSGEVADETFNRLDSDKNGQITFDEFAAGFQQYKQTSASSKQQAAPSNSNEHPHPSRVAPRSPCESPSSSFRSASGSFTKLSPSPVSLRAKSRASPSGPPGSLGSAGAGGSSGNLTASGRSTSSGTQFDLSSSYELNSSCDMPIQQSASANDLLGSPASASASYAMEPPLGAPQSAQEDVIVYSSDAMGAAAGGSNNYGSGQFGSMLSSSSSYSQVKTMQDLLECVQKLQNENQILTQIFFKDKREREEYISQLGEEFDHQLREVEERANKRAREELESEKKRLRDMMQTERETLEHHYKTLEKVSKMAKSSQAHGGKLEIDEGLFKVKSQLEDTFNENRQLKKSLLDTKTDVALIWKEMEKLKKQYEDKLSNAYEKQRETQYECDHIKKQLNLMQDSNRKLQDASDVITNYITDKVEPVIKVALDGSDEYGFNSLNGPNSLKALGASNSASNSRRGSILSEYLNTNKNNCANSNGHETDSISDRITSIDINSSKGKHANPAHMNGSGSAISLDRRSDGVSLESEFSELNEKPQASDNHLSVPKAQQRQQFDANLKSSKSAAELTLQKKQPAKREAQQDNLIQDSPMSGSEKQAAGSLPKPEQQQQQGNKSSALKNLGRHFMLGNRTLSETKTAGSQDGDSSKVKLVESKSTSAEQVQDSPSVEPADGPSVATFNIILVGDSFVGKSSFAARFIEGSFVQGLISNCSIDFKTKSYKVDGINYTVNLWDTAGQERFRSITASYFRKADGIILMYDVTDKRSYLNVRNWMGTISDTAAENVAVLLVGNKIDLRLTENKAKCVPTEEGFRLAKEYEIVFLETSVKTGTNLLPSMGKLIRLIAKNNTPEEEDTDRIRLSDKNRTFNCMPKNC